MKFRGIIRAGLALLALCLGVMGCDDGAPQPAAKDKAAGESAQAPAKEPGSAPGSQAASAPGSAPASAPGSQAASAPSLPADKLEGQGVEKRYGFKFTMIPAVPKLNEMFKVETVVTDLSTGKPVSGEGLEFKLDATMPEHKHGMMTQPSHKPLDGGKFLSEGMKFHMPGSWQFRGDFKGPAGADHVELRYNQPAMAHQ